ncbi:hypothetical protein INR49_002557 [Caranx melampygus]|nr:hypothetical protein INR49_002557 [Caranx melampygus]
MEQDTFQTSKMTAASPSVTVDAEVDGVQPWWIDRTSVEISWTAFLYSSDQNLDITSSISPLGSLVLPSSPPPAADGGLLHRAHCSNIRL